MSRPFVPLVFPCAGLPLSAPCPQQLRQHTEGSGPRQQEQRFLQPSPQKRETLESLRKTVAFVAANPGPGCSPCVGAAAAARRGLPALPCVAAVAGPGLGLPALRALALPGVAAGAGALSVLFSVVPGSPGGGWSWCRLAAVSVCCPVLPEAVVGASRATRGRLASTQGCRWCSCPSPWARPLVRRAWWPVAALPARSASTQRQHRPRQQRQRSSATLSQKKRNRRSLRKHVAFVAVRLPVLPLLSAVRLLLRSCGPPAVA